MSITRRQRSNVREFDGNERLDFKHVVGNEPFRIGVSGSSDDGSSLDQTCSVHVELKGDGRGM